MFDHHRISRASFLAAVLVAGFSVPVLAQSGSVALDNLSFPVGDKGLTVSIKRVDVTGTNLSRDEVAVLFVPGTPKDKAADILKKMRAQKFSIPEIRLKDANTDFTLRNFDASDVVEGRVARVGLAGFDGILKAEKGGQGTVKGGSVEIIQTDLIKKEIKERADHHSFAKYVYGWWNAIPTAF